MSLLWCKHQRNTAWADLTTETIYLSGRVTQNHSVVTAAEGTLTFLKPQGFPKVSACLLILPLRKPRSTADPQITDKHLLCSSLVGGLGWRKQAFCCYQIGTYFWFLLFSRKSSQQKSCLRQAEPGEYMGRCWWACMQKWQPDVTPGRHTQYTPHTQCTHTHIQTRVRARHSTGKAHITHTTCTHTHTYKGGDETQYW